MAPDGCASSITNRLMASIPSSWTSPCVLVATASASRSQMFVQTPLFAKLGAVMLLLYLAWYVLQRALSKVSRADASLQALTISFPNPAGVGLPIASSVLGPTGTVPAAVALAAGCILVSPLSPILVEMSSSKEGGGVGTPLAQIFTALPRSLFKPVVGAPALASCPHCPS
jgi:malonate transporter